MAAPKMGGAKNPVTNTKAKVLTDLKVPKSKPQSAVAARSSVKGKAAKKLGAPQSKKRQSYIRKTF